VQVGRDLLEVARDLDAPGAVPEVALDLPHHAVHRVGAELGLVRGVVAVERADEGDPGGLDQVLDGDSGSCELVGKGADQGLVPLDDRFPELRVTILYIEPQELLRREAPERRFGYHRLQSSRRRRLALLMLDDRWADGRIRCGDYFRGCLLEGELPPRLWKAYPEPCAS
jgi:hypothetical protein